MHRMLCVAGMLLAALALSGGAFFFAGASEPSQLTVECGSSQNVLTWTLPAGHTVNSVIRNVNGGDGAYVCGGPGSIPPCNNLNVATFTDTDVQAGSQYRYFHKAFPDASSNFVTCPSTVPLPPPSTPPPQTVPPSAATGAADSITQTGARVSGTVAPGSAAVVAWFQYGPTSALQFQTSGQSFPAGGSSAAIYISLANLTPGTTYYYRVVATGADGAATGEVASFQTAAPSSSPPPPPDTSPPPSTSPPPAPAVDLFVNGSHDARTVPYGTVVRVIWSASNADSCLITPGNLTGASGEVSSAPLTRATTFKATCEGAGGSAMDSVTIEVGSPPEPPAPTGEPPTVATLEVGELTKTTVTLPGVVHPGAFAAKAWFEYGLSRSALGSSTAPVAVRAGAGSTVVSIRISATPETTYFYRIVARNSFGTRRGEIKQATSAGAASLTIDRPRPTMYIGEQVQFHAYYDSDGAGSFAPDEVTESAVWVSSNPAALESVGRGLFAARDSGDAAVTAYYGGPGAVTSVKDPAALSAKADVTVRAEVPPQLSGAPSAASSSTPSSLWSTWFAVVVFVAAVAGAGTAFFFWRRKRKEKEGEGA